MNRSLRSLASASILAGVVSAGILLAGPRSAPAAPAVDEPGRWAFAPAPDDFRADALLDLRSLNEKVAGESGFLKADAEGDFRLGNGQPVRLWAVNTDVGREKPYTIRPLGRKTEPDLARHARFLAKRGVNMIRLHTHLNPDLKKHPDAKLTDVNTEERDWIWRTVAAMKKEGIYTTISPYWANTMQISDAWGVPGGKQDAHSLLFFDEKLQEGYRAWLKALFTEKNPYTGIPLAQDAGVGIIQLQNEDSLLFWTINGLKGEQRTRLGKTYGDWLKKKYATLDAALAAWKGDHLPGDDLAAGVIDFHNIYEMTQNRTGGRSQRLADQLQFWSETMYAFNRGTAAFLRNELGCKQLINAGNWKTADTARLTDAERWSYTANDVLAVNHYFGGMHVGANNGWAIVNGDQFTSKSALKEPWELPINLRQVKGKPMLVTESAWVMPNRYAAEGPFLISAYQSLTGVDAYYWFATSDDEFTAPESANGYMPSQKKWLIGNPDMLGNFPAAALMFRKGYVRRGAPAVTEQRPLADLWARQEPLLAEGASFDPNRDQGNVAAATARGKVPAEEFLMGPVQVQFGSADPDNTRVTDPKQYLDASTRTIRSVTGELTLNYGQGWCTVNTSRAQGVAAHFKDQHSFKLADVEITADNDFGAVYAVSMDEKPLKTSGKVLLQVGTECRPTGWKESPVTIDVKEGKFPGFKIDSYGGAPWQVVRAAVTVKLSNPTLKKATALDANGNAVGDVPLTKTAGGVSLRFPENALYVVLQ